MTKKVGFRGPLTRVRGRKEKRERQFMIMEQSLEVQKEFALSAEPVRNRRLGSEGERYLCGRKRYTRGEKG